MAALLFVLVLLLEAAEAALSSSRGTACLYHRAGDDVTLTLHGRGGCDATAWSHDAAALARPLLQDVHCSLPIDNVAAEDAGCYSTRTDRLCLFVLNVYQTPPDAEPLRGGEMTLHCALFRSTSYTDCGQSNVLWLDEAGTELLHDDDACEAAAAGSCVSNLTVDAEPGRTFTCQVMNETYDVVIEANYTVAFAESSESSESSEWSTLSFVMLTLRVSLLVLMIVITVLAVVRKQPETKSQRVKEVRE